jgi:hypothetical protein
MEVMKLVFLFLGSLPKEGTIRRGLSFQLGYNLREGDTPRCQDSCRLKKAATLLPPPLGGGTPHGGWRVAKN